MRGCGESSGRACGMCRARVTAGPARRDTDMVAVGLMHIRWVSKAPGDRQWARGASAAPSRAGAKAGAAVSATQLGGRGLRRGWRTGPSPELRPAPTAARERREPAAMRRGRPRPLWPAARHVPPNQELPHGRSGCGGGTSGCGPGAPSAAAPGATTPGPAAPAVMSAPRPPQPALPAALLLFVLLALGARASDVVELTDADFESGLAERPGLVLVEFFAPW